MWTQESKSDFRSVAIVFWTLVTIIAVVQLSFGRPYLNPEDFDESARISISLAERGRFPHDYFNSLHEELVKLSTQAQNPSTYWQDVYVLGIDGRFYPIHSIIFPALGAPWYKVAGELGLWFWNQLLLFCCVISFFLLLRDVDLSRVARVGTLAFIALTQFVLYSWGYSYDVYGAALTLLGFALVPRSPIAAGMLAALAVEVRPTALYFIPFTLLWGAYISSFQRRRVIMHFILGTVVVLTLLAWMNQHFWGDPFTTQFQRRVVLNQGLTELSSYSAELDLRRIFVRLDHKLFDSEYGLILYNPLLCLLPGLLALQRTEHFKSLVILGVVGIGYMLIIFAVSDWPGHFGNRYLMPVIPILGVICIAVAAAIASIVKRKLQLT